MSDFDRKTELYGEERKKVAAEEERKELLLDKSVGAPHPVLRPDDNFIEAHLGKPRTQDEIERDTVANAQQRSDAEHAQNRRQREVEESIARHNASIRERGPQNDAQAQAPKADDNSQAAEQERGGLRDYLLRQRERKQTHGRSR